MSRIARFTLVILACAAGGCRHRDYAGDGVFIDHGFLNYSRRYEIDFGPVDLSRAGASHSFAMKGLPEAHLIAGVELVPASDAEREPSNAPGRVELEIRDSKNRIVVMESRPFIEWDWQRGATGPLFLYSRGESRELPTDNPKRTVPEKLGVKTSGGWGTYFEPTKSESYSLRLVVLEPARSPQTARLRVHGSDK